MTDRGPRKHPPAPRSQPPRFQGELAELESLFVHATDGDRSAAQAWRAHLARLLDAVEVAPTPSFLALESMLRFHIARAPAALLCGAAGLAGLVATLCHRLEASGQAGLASRGRRLLALLAGRLEVRGWSGRRDDDWIAAYDRVLHCVCGSRSRVPLEAWLLLLTVALPKPPVPLPPRTFRSALATRLLSTVETVPAAWLTEHSRSGRVLRVLARTLAVPAEPESIDLACEIAQRISDRTAPL